MLNAAAVVYSVVGTSVGPLACDAYACRTRYAVLWMHEGHCCQYRNNLTRDTLVCCRQQNWWKRKGTPAQGNSNCNALGRFRMKKVWAQLWSAGLLFVRQVPRTMWIWILFSRILLKMWMPPLNKGNNFSFRLEDERILIANFPFDVCSIHCRQWHQLWFFLVKKRNLAWHIGRFICPSSGQRSYCGGFFSIISPRVLWKGWCISRFFHHG